MVAHWQQVEDSDRSNYTVHFHAEVVPTHVGVGLFQIGADCCGREVEEDC